MKWNGDRVAARRARAVTMLELMMVITILGVLMAVTLPRLGGSNERAALRTTARDMAQLAAYARQSAVSMGKPTRIVINREGREWWLDLPPAEDSRVRADDWERVPDSASHRDWPLAQEERARPLHRKVEFFDVAVGGRELRETGRAAIYFYPNGSSDGAAIVLRNTRERLMTVEIERATGRALAYAGPQKTFAERLEELGVDPAGFVDPSVLADAMREAESEPGAGFYRAAGGREERAAAYADAAARIMGRVQRDEERRRAVERENGNRR